MPDSTVGVDISKAHLDVYLAPSGKAARFSNDGAGFKQLIAWIESPVRSVTYEPTGRWHRAFEEALLKAELPLVRVNPLQARRFAQAIGQRAKTDAVDARVLAQMGAALELRPTEASSPARRALEELQVARDSVVKDRTAALNRQKQVRHRLLRQQHKNRLAQLDRHLAAIDTEIGKHLADDVVLARRTEILTSIPGVARITAAGLLIQMPELGRLDAKAVASLAGLAPVTRQSGAWAGPQLYSGRPGASAAASLHAGLGGNLLQPGPAREVPPARRAGKAAEGRCGGRHAQAPRAGQRATWRGSLLVARPAWAEQRSLGGKRAGGRRMTSCSTSTAFAAWR